MTQFQGSRAGDWVAFVEGIRRLAVVVDRALRRLADAVGRAQRQSAEQALRFQRARSRAWKAADAPRIRHLNNTVGPVEKLTPDEEAQLATVLERKPRGRPGGKIGPGTLLEKIFELAAWSQMPTAMPSERRQQLRRYPPCRRMVAEAYASEFMRLRLEDGAKRRERGAYSRHEVAERAVAGVFGLSPSKVRALKAGSAEEATDLNMLAELRVWVETGVD